MTKRPLIAIIVGSVAALALAGCASADPGSSPSEDATGPVGAELELSAAWLDGGRSVALLTHGSSSCVPVATDVAPQADGSVAVELEDPDGTPCTRDFVPRVSLIGVPSAASTSDPLTVVVAYGDARGQVELPAYDGPAVEEFTPSASWIGDGGDIAILSYGSSSCAPVVATTAASPGEVTVTFADFPANQVCTADMAPRAALAAVDPASVDRTADATLTLTGGDFSTPVTIPLAG